MCNATAMTDYDEELPIDNQDYLQISSQNFLIFLQENFQYVCLYSYLNFGAI